MHVLIVQRPEIQFESLSPTRAQFVVEPLEPGFGHTLGNTMRRTLLSRIPGAAVSSVRIEKAPHEFTTVPGVEEDVVDIVLNIKGLVVRMLDQEPQVLTLSVKGPGAATAADLEIPSGVQIVNPDLQIATLAEGGVLEMEMTVEQGVGYRSAEKNQHSDVIGVIPVDSFFSPVRHVAFRVEPTQVGQMTNFDQLVLDVETDGSIGPREAVSSAGKTLRELLGLFADVGEGVGLELGDIAVTSSAASDLDLEIDVLDLSERPRNCLRRANINTVGDLVKSTAKDLLAITNFGHKSLEEVNIKLDSLGLSIAAEDEEAVSV